MRAKAAPGAGQCFARRGIDGVGQRGAGARAAIADDAMVAVFQVLWMGRRARMGQIARRGVHAQRQVGDMAGAQ